MWFVVCMINIWVWHFAFLDLVCTSARLHICWAARVIGKRQKFISSNLATWPILFIDVDDKYKYNYKYKYKCVFKCTYKTWQWPKYISCKLSMLHLASIAKTKSAAYVIWKMCEGRVVCMLHTWYARAVCIFPRRDISFCLSRYVWWGSFPVISLNSMVVFIFSRNIS